MTPGKAFASSWDPPQLDPALARSASLNIVPISDRPLDGCAALFVAVWNRAAKGLPSLRPLDAGLAAMLLRRSMSSRLRGRGASLRAPDRIPGRRGRRWRSRTAAWRLTFPSGPGQSTIRHRLSF